MPFFVRLYSEKQLRYLVSLQKNDVFCYFDATGSVVAKPPWIDTKIFYYALVLPGNKKSALPVAELISSQHDTPSITYFLSSFVRDLKSIHSSNKPVISKIETDFSLVLIQSVLTAFNKMHLMQYLILTFNYIVRPDKYSLDTFVVVHICASHIMKNTGHRINSLTTKKWIRHLSRKVVAAIINSANLPGMTVYWVHAVKVFGIATKFQGINNSLAYLNCGSRVESGALPEECLFARDYYPLRTNSPFYEYFADIMNTTLKEYSGVTGENTNFFYAPIILHTILRHLLAFYPLCSGIVIKKFGIRRDSNTTVESWFNTVKNNIFRSKLRRKVPRFITIMEDLIHPILLERVISLETTKKAKRVKFNQSLNVTLSEEMWSKKSQPVQGSYFATYSKMCKENSPEKEHKELLLHSTPDKTGNPEIFYCDENITPIKNQYCTAQSPIELKTVKRAIFECDKNITPTTNHVPCTAQSPIELGTHPPWQAFYSYPELKKPSYNIAGLELHQDSLTTLYPDCWLDDNIINSILLIMQQKAAANYMKVVTFDTTCATKIFSDKMYSLDRWAAKRDIMSADIWIIPITKYL